MAKPAKGLKTLIRLSKFNVDERRRVLTALQNREDQIIEEIRQGELRLKEEQRLAAEDAAGIGYLYGAYHKAWMQRRDQMHQALTAVRAEIEVARDELAEAFRQQKTYEVTQANREKAEREEADRKEQIFLDEVGSNIHRRKEKDAEAE
ncbi:MAG: flagellar FliJ family protein [Rhodospirillaceae bacterium]|nr:flagellar FliJ family protein [Rhodospirillales bacterium]